MKPGLDPKLSEELQELFLLNKQWLEEILFLEDETRFFRNLFNGAFSAALKTRSLKEIENINSILGGLEERREKLKKLINQHKHLLECLLDQSVVIINLELIEAGSTIAQKVTELFSQDRSVKKELFAFVEGVIVDNNKKHLILNS